MAGFPAHAIVQRFTLCYSMTMSQLELIYNSIRFVGIRSVARSILYARQRSRYERRYALPAAGKPIPPGLLLKGESRPGGGRLSFEKRSLDVQFLDADIVRLTWDNAAPPLPYALSDKTWPGAPVSATQENDAWRIKSAALEIEISRSGAQKFYSTDGHLLADFSPPLFSDYGWHLPFSFQPAERIYGLGERAMALDRRGHKLTLWNTEAGGSYHMVTSPLYLNIPMWMGVHEQGSYIIFIENPYRSEFDLCENPSIHFYDGALQFYFIPGAPSEALPRFVELTGRPPLPPRWSLGYHQSRWGYKNEKDIRDIVASFQANDLPLHVVHLDIDYMRGYRVFTVDKNRFPDLANLARDLQKQNVRLVTILDPGVKVDAKYDVYQSGLKDGTFCKMPEGEMFKAPVWPSWCAFPDFTSPSGRVWWGRQYAKMVELGISGYWHDMNEPSTFAAWGESTMPNAVQQDLEGRKGDHRQAHNLYGLLMNRAAFEGLRRLQPQNRPWMVTRSGWAGIGRYAWKWSGDVYGSWEMLRGTLALLIGLSMSGVYFVGSDIGGFSNHPTPELYSRWFQMASFTPFFRTHSATSLPPREPWCFDKRTLDICRAALKFRTRMLPYYYTLAWQAASQGLPFMRPLFWHEPHNQALWGIEDAFLLGDGLLVAPVLDPGKTGRTLCLPSGRWYDFYSGQVHTGGQTIEIEAPLERVPLFVKAGSILALAGDHSLEMHVFVPGRAQEPTSSFLYSDNGDGYAAFRIDTYQVIERDASLEIGWQSEGDFPWPYEQVDWILHGFDAVSALQAGKPLTGQADRWRSGSAGAIKFKRQAKP